MMDAFAANLEDLGPARLARMVEISRVLNSTTNLDDLLRFIITEAAALTGSESASILLLDPATRQLRFKATSGSHAPKLLDFPVPIENSIAGAILTSNQPLIIDDVTQDARWNPKVSQAIQFKTRSILGVPMHDGERTVGVLESVNKQQGTFSFQDSETLSALADLAGVAVEKARLITQLTQANRKLNELDELKSGFIAIASHELRTPLSVILGYVSFLRESIDPELANQMDAVMDAAVQLRSIMQNMFNLQFVDTGRLKLDLEIFDFSILAQEVTARYIATATMERTLTVRTPNEPLPVAADRNMIEVVLGNLLDNAIKFTSRQGIVAVIIERHGHELWCSVRDNGVGIPLDKLDRIFDRFYQVEHFMRRQAGGLGLGLSLAKELLTLHNGRIWVESVVGKGSKFDFALPLVMAS
ncbi:MAG: GAF domain-containing sensor histidine kinase [Anaerolineae bacterium]|nr:GAF domain-containing sensor histidine kinase [Anaerolineae bacterium]